MYKTRTIHYDDFTRRLVEICNTVEGNTQQVSHTNTKPHSSILLVQCGITLGIVRCDYMLHTGSCDEAGVRIGGASPKLVEMNTIAASYLGMSPEIVNIHRCVHSERYCV